MVWLEGPVVIPGGTDPAVKVALPSELTVMRPTWVEKGFGPAAPTFNSYNRIPVLKSCSTGNGAVPPIVLTSNAPPLLAM
jgi:hypothetical protein